MTMSAASSIQKNQFYFYTSSEHSENEIIKTFPLTVVSKRIKQEEILTKEVQDLYTENCKTLLKVRLK